MNSTDSLLQLPIDDDLYLRLARTQDAEALFQIIDTQRPYLREWLPFIDMSTSTSVTELYLQSMTAVGNSRDLLFVMVYREEAAGLIGFKEIDSYNKKLEIGYWLSEKLQGKGIVRRSCETLIRYAFEKMEMNRIQIKVGVGNSKSSRIPQKLKFSLEGIQREAEYLNGRFHDLEMYSLLKHEWYSTE